MEGGGRPRLVADPAHPVGAILPQPKVKAHVAGKGATRTLRYTSRRSPARRSSSSRPPRSGHNVLKTRQGRRQGQGPLPARRGTLVQAHDRGAGLPGRPPAQAARGRALRRRATRSSSAPKVRLRRSGSERARHLAQGARARSRYDVRVALRQRPPPRARAAGQGTLAEGAGGRPQGRRKITVRRLHAAPAARARHGADQDGQAKHHKKRQAAKKKKRHKKHSRVRRVSTPASSQPTPQRLAAIREQLKLLSDYL